MRLFDGLFEFTGVVVNPMDVQALTAEQIQNMQARDAIRMQPAQFSPYQAALAQNIWQPLPVPEKPLDERFADFKVRLAAAIDRRKLGH